MKGSDAGERAYCLSLLLSRGNLGVTTPHDWPSISRQVFLGLGALCISRGSLSWKPITGCMPTRVRLDRGPLGEQAGEGSGEGERRRRDCQFLVM